MNLRIFHQAQEVTLPAEAYERAAVFAYAVVGTVNYKDSNQTNKQRITEDHRVSKLGEEAVRKVFLSHSFQVKGPDYEIYKGKQKSWESDLFIDDIGLAVKTQTRISANRYGLSWTFQCSPQRKDPILNEPLAWVCFTVLEKATVKVFPPFQIQELTFRNPKLAHLIGKKQVIYAEDLPLLDRIG